MEVLTCGSVNFSSSNESFDIWLFHGPMSAPQNGVSTCSSFMDQYQLLKWEYVDMQFFMSQCQLFFEREVTLLLNVASQVRVIKVLPL